MELGISWETEMNCVKSLLVFVVLFLVTACQDVAQPQPASETAAWAHHAKLYRQGQCEKADLVILSDYFQSQVGKMTVAEVKALMGEPKVLTPKDGYYTYACEPLYDYPDDETTMKGKHDQVLLYGENGPAGDHWIGDETLNLFILFKDGLIVSTRLLSP